MALNQIGLLPISGDEIPLVLNILELVVGRRLQLGNLIRKKVR